MKALRLGFTSKDMTAYGGVATLVAKFWATLGLREWIEEAMPIQERSPNGKGVWEKAAGHMITVMVGGRRFAHMGWWGHGKEVLQRALGVTWLPQSTSVLTRFWNKIGTMKLAEQWGDKTRELAVNVVERDGITEDELRLDSSVCQRYGKQEGAKKGYNPKKPGRPSHHPLIAMLGSGYVVNLWNRAGNTSSSNNVIGFLDQTLGLLRLKVRITRILADSGFYLSGVVARIEGAIERMYYIITVPVYPVIRQKVACIKAWRAIADGIDVAEFRFQHAADGWDCARRYVAVRKAVRVRPQAAGKQMVLLDEYEMDVEYRVTVLLTNDEKTAPEEIWRQYRPRAGCENVIKEAKYDYALNGFSLGSFYATEAVMVMNTLVVYNLMHYLNRTIINNGAPTERLSTLRGKYLIIPAVLGSAGRYTLVRMAVKSREVRGRLRYLYERISRVCSSLNCNAFGFT